MTCEQGCCDGARTPTTAELLKSIHTDAWMHHIEARNRHYLRYGMLLGLWLAERNDVMFELMKDRNGENDMGTVRDMLVICHRRMTTVDEPLPGLAERLEDAEQWAACPEDRKCR